jgi:hypothetical protein
MVVIVPRTITRPVAPAPRPSDESLVTVRGMLDVSGRAEGTGKAIRPPGAALDGAKALCVPPFGGVSEAGRFSGHTDEVTDLAVSPDGTRVVSGSKDGTVRVWDTSSRRAHHMLSGHTGPVLTVALSRDGRRGLSGGEDCVLRLWDVEAGKLVARYDGHRDGIMAVAFSADGRRSLSAGTQFNGARPGSGTDPDIWVRDLETGRVVERWSGLVGLVTSLAVSPDGSLALSSGSCSLLLSVSRGKSLLQLQGGQPQTPSRAIFSPDGRSAIVTAGRHQVRVFNVSDGGLARVLHGHAENVDSLAVSPDGKTLISGSGPERVLRVWELGSGRQLGKTSPDVAPGPGRYAPDGRRAYWGFSDGTVREYSVPIAAPGPGPSAPAERSVPLVRTLEARIEDLAVGGGGRYLCLKLTGARLALFDVNEARVVETVALPSARTLIAAGARRFVIADLEHATIETRAFESPASPIKKGPLPIRAPVRSLTMGRDSTGPVLAVWVPDPVNNVPETFRFSFLDPETLDALKVGPVTAGIHQVLSRRSSTGGSFTLQQTFTLHPSIRQRLHVRASPEGNVFAIWQTPVTPTGLQTLAVLGAKVTGLYKHDTFDPVTPSADGRSFYTGKGGVVDLEGNPVRPPELGEEEQPIAIPSADPAYDLDVAGPVRSAAASPGAHVRVVVRAAGTVGSCSASSAWTR